MLAPVTPLPPVLSLPPAFKQPGLGAIPRSPDCGVEESVQTKRGLFAIKDLPIKLEKLPRSWVPTCLVNDVPF